MDVAARFGIGQSAVSMALSAGTSIKLVRRILERYAGLEVTEERTYRIAPRG